LLAVVQDVSQVPALSDRFSFPLFAKPLAEGTSKGVSPASRVTHQDELNDVCAELLRRYRQPVLIEEYLPGREFTVGLLGTGQQASVLGTLEIILRDQAEPEIYSYANKENCEELVEYRLVHSDNDETVRQAEAIALAAWRPGELSAVATEAASTCVVILRGIRSFWKPIRWPVCIPLIPICRCWRPRWALLMSNSFDESWTQQQCAVSRRCRNWTHESPGSAQPSRRRRGGR
jgi:hypothetical protein